MSQSNIEAFLAQAESDAALRAEITRISEEASRTVAASLARLSEGTATPFTAEEFLASQSSHELSEEELEAVAGGKKRAFTSIGTIILPGRSTKPEVLSDQS